MKKFIKKELIYIIPMMLLTSITTLAFNYIASDVGFTPTDSNWNVSNVQTATDSLYYSITRRNPVGEIIAFMGNNSPDFFLECDGSTYAISDYPYLAEFIRTEFGSYNYFGGNGTTTFTVPDLRGEFLRGRGTNSHSNQGSGATTSGVHQDATQHVYIYGANYTKNIYFVGDLGPYNVDSIVGNSNTYQTIGRDSTGSANMNNFYTSRPTNTSVMYAIRYE